VAWHVGLLNTSVARGWKLLKIKGLPKIEMDSEIPPVCVTAMGMLRCHVKVRNLLHLQIALRGNAGDRFGSGGEKTG